MEKKTRFVDIQELNEYVKELSNGDVLLTKEELTELYNYIRSDSLVPSKDRIRLLDEVTTLIAM